MCLFMFQSQTRRLLPRNSVGNLWRDIRRNVSIADATLASSQPRCWWSTRLRTTSFNRRRDACFLATLFKYMRKICTREFQSQTRRLLPRNLLSSIHSDLQHQVSIADATLASSQQEREKRERDKREVS